MSASPMSLGLKPSGTIRGPVNSEKLTYGPVAPVIPGWTEALQKMQEGAVWELYIPADLAYGPSGTSGLVGPNATLIFEVELIEVIAE